MTEYEAPKQVLIFVCLLCFSSSLLFRLTRTTHTRKLVSKPVKNVPFALSIERLASLIMEAIGKRKTNKQNQTILINIGRIYTRGRLRRLRHLRRLVSIYEYGKHGRRVKRQTNTSEVKWVRSYLTDELVVSDVQDV